VERELEGEPNMLTLRELAPVAENDDSEHMKMQGMGEMGHQGMDMKQMQMGEHSMQVETPKGEISHGYRGPTVTVTDAGRTRRYRVVASHFEDTTTFFPMLDQHEVWQFFNLTEDTHPIHLHLDPFQIISRRPIRYKIPKGAIEEVTISAAVDLERDPNDTLDHQIDGNERGLKDTIRVNPNEIVEIDVRFTKYCGRYMYHCHILEHEDRDMMRPFVTMPSELMPFMA
jgi:spore coat protein A